MVSMTQELAPSHVRHALACSAAPYSQTCNQQPLISVIFHLMFEKAVSMDMEKKQAQFEMKYCTLKSYKIDIFKTYYKVIKKY